MSRILFLGFSLLTFVSLNAQIKPFAAGDKNVAININPVFSYVGNIFNNSENNDLFLSSFGFIYRKGLENNRARRFSANLDLSRNITYIKASDPYSITTEQYAFNVALGKEYYITRGKKNRWRPYGGFAGLVGLSSSKTSYDYDNSLPEFTGERLIESNNGVNPFLGISGFLGTDYYFSNEFFIGIELIASATIGYQSDSKTTTEIYTTDATGNIVLKTTETQSGGEGFEWRIISSNPIIFRAGLRF
jgi:hypothetical protein